MRLDKRRAIKGPRPVRFGFVIWNASKTAPSWSLETAAGIRDRHLDQRDGDGSVASMCLGLAENQKNVPIAGNCHLRLPEFE